MRPTERPRQNAGRWAREIFTTEYTEAGEPILKNTEMDSVYSVWERSDLSVKFCGKKLPRKLPRMV